MGRGHKSKRKLRRLRSVTAPYEEEEEKRYAFPDWVVNINDFINKGKTFQSGRSWTIFRVPTSLRKVQQSAFYPKRISIGPFHYKTDDPMYDHKMRYLVRLLGGKVEKINESNTEEEIEPQPRKEVRLENLVEAMMELEPKMRDCYSELFDNLDSDDFVNMMVTDGCFVIELLRLHFKSVVNQNEVDDPIFTTPWMLRTLRHDLIMLENQLPSFVLEKLFEMTSVDGEPSLRKLAVTFFNPLLQRENASFEEDPTTRDYKHLLDVFRSTFIKITGKKFIGSVHIKANANLCCASELQEAGVQLKKKEDGELIDIEYKDGVLHIPELLIDDNMVPLFLNFVAYEQCDEKANSYFTNYFLFMDGLINSSTDIQILHNSGIMNHVLGSDEDVAKLINKLCREIAYDLDHCHLADQMKGLNDYCKAYHQNQWLYWWRNLKRTHFSSPWTLISLVAAIFLLLITTAQTFYIIYSYYEPIDGTALRISTA